MGLHPRSANGGFQDVVIPLEKGFCLSKSAAIDASWSTSKPVCMAIYLLRQKPHKGKLFPERLSLQSCQLNEGSVLKTILHLAAAF